MKMTNYEFRIDHKISGEFPSHGIIFYGNDLMTENNNKTFLVTKLDKNRLMLFNPTYEQTVIVTKKKLRKFVDDLALEFPHVVFCVAFEKKEVE